MTDEKQKSPKRRGCMWSSAVVAVLIITLIPALFIWNNHLRKQSLKILGEIPNAPIGIEGFNKLYPAPENNEKYLTQFFAVPDENPEFIYNRKGYSSTYKFSTLYGKIDLDDAALVRMEEFYSDSQNIARADAIEKLLEIPAMQVFGIEEHLNGESIKIAVFRWYVNFFVFFKLQHAVDAGNTELALKHYYDMGKLIDFSVSMPMMVPYFVMSSFERKRIEELSYLFSYGNPTDGQLAELDSYLLEREKVLEACLKSALSNEAGFMYMLFTIGYLKTLLSEPPSFFGEVRAVLYENLLLVHDRLYLMKSLKAIYSCVAEDNYHYAPFESAMNESVPIYSILSRLSLSSFHKLNFDYSDFLGWSRSARTAIAVERYRMKNGTFPDDLRALVPEFLPEVLLNPFNGNPLEYEHGDLEFHFKRLHANEYDEDGNPVFFLDEVIKVFPGYSIAAERERGASSRPKIRFEVIHGDEIIQE